MSGAQASGGSGQNDLTVSAASPAQSALLARWQETPEVSVDLEQPEAARETTRTHKVTALLPDTTPRTSPLPRLPSQPQHAAAPQVDTTRAAQPDRSKVIPQTRPKARPKPVSQTQGDAAPAQPERRAAGTAKAAQRGSSGSDASQARDTRQSNALRAKWGAMIHAKVQKNVRYPRGASGMGTAKLSLNVAANGKLQKVSLLQSSGDALLDKAAFHAVQRAGRFAKAPLELTEAVYAFSLALTFTR
ncbi:MAG: TonB family protein [Roseobacter sp.]